MPLVSVHIEEVDPGKHAYTYEPLAPEKAAGRSGPVTRPLYHFLYMCDAFSGLETTLGRQMLEALSIFDCITKGRIRIVFPRAGEAAALHAHILERNWAADERRTLAGLPGILVLNRSISSFDPRLHPWIYLNLDAHIDDNHNLRLKAFKGDLQAIARYIGDGHSLIRYLRAMHYRKDVAAFGEVFEAKPRVFGFTIDLVKLARLVRAKLKG